MRIMAGIWVLALAFSAWGQLCWAGQHYFVRLDGNDQHSGLSPARAWRSIDRLNRHVFTRGDTVYFQGGATFVGSIRIADHAGLRLEGLGAVPAVIFSGEHAGLELVNSSHVVVRHLHFRGSGSPHNHSHGLHIAATHPARQFRGLRFQHLDVSGYGLHGIFVSSLWANAGFRDVRFSHIQSHHNVLSGLTVDSRYPSRPHKNVRVAFVQTSFNPGDPQAKSHSGSGIVLGGVDGGRIEHSEAFENGALSMPTASGGPVGIWTWNARRVVMQYNKSHHNHCGCPVDGGGFDIDGGVTDSVLRYNFSAFNDGYGYQFAQFPYAPTFARNRISHNISYADARAFEAGGIQIWGPVGGESVISKNIIYSTQSMHPKAAQIFFTEWSGEGLHVTDNVYYSHHEGPVAVMEASTGRRLRMDRNHFFAGGDFNRVLWQGVTYTNIRDWAQATGLETESSFVRQAAINVDHLNFLHQKKLTRKHFQRAHRLFKTARMGGQGKAGQGMPVRQE
jgi:hypothetical protein